jgi:hypothetical protein
MEDVRATQSPVDRIASAPHCKQMADAKAAYCTWCHSWNPESP